MTEIAERPVVGLRWVGLAGLLLAEAMNLLDTTIATVAAPVVRADLGGAARDVAWVVSAYTLPFAVLLLAGGRLGDRYGRRRVLAVGVSGFVVCSLACACAPTMGVLLTGRALQGAFAALVVPQTIGLVKAAFHGPELPRALSLIGPVMGLTAVAGPVLGGLLTRADLAGLYWRAVFLVNLPLGLLALATLPCLVEDRAEDRPSLDLTGVALSAVAGAAFVVPAVGSGPGWLVVVGIVGVLALVAHVRRRAARGRHPIVVPELFSDRGFPAALVTSLLYFAMSTGLTLAAVLYVQVGMHGSVLHSSLVVLPFAVGLAVSSLIAGQVLVPRLGPRLMYPGLGLLALGLGLGVVAATDDGAVVSVWVPLGLGVAGLGGGLLTVPFFTAALSRVRAHEVGSAAGALNAVQQLGSTFGAALLSRLYLSGGHLPAAMVAACFGACLLVCVPLLASTRRMLRA